MLTESQSSQLQPIVRTLQIIVGVLVLGVLNFLAVVLFLIVPAKDQTPVQPFLTFIAAGGAAVAILASVVVPLLLARSLRNSFAESAATGEVRPAAQVYQNLLITRCAILEGAAFFCLVSYMIERQPIGLVAVGVLLVLLLAQFPTLSRVAAWIENELKVAEQMQQLRQ